MALQYGAYIAMAGIGLYAMFVGEIISIFNFMNDPEIVIEPASKILQFISIGVAPGVIMSGASYMIARKFGSKQIGWLVIVGGVVLLVGMLYAYTMLGQHRQRPSSIHRYDNPSIIHACFYTSYRSRSTII